MNQQQSKRLSLGEKILHFFLPPHEAESIIGDLEESYNGPQDKKRYFPRSIWYWLQIFKTILRSISVWSYWQAAMLKTNVKHIWRNIRRQKVYSFINITGLAVGMAICVSILIWVRYEYSFDRFHANKDELFQVILASEDASFKDPATVGLIAGFLEKEYPDIIRASNLGRTEYKLAHKGQTFISKGLLVNPGFLEMFSFPLISGEPQNILKDPQAIVITQEMALKLIGEDEAIGKTLWVEDRWPFKITGVVKNIPRNSSIQFEFLLPYLTLRSNRDQWNWRDIHESYVQLQSGVSYNGISQKISEVYNDHNPGEYKQFLSLRPLSRVHLHHPNGGGLISYVTIFSIMAAVILMIACINFINLATACSEKRFKEIGIKKVVGSTRAQLVQQFLSEYMLISLLALILALILVQLLLPSVGTLIGQQLELHISIDLTLIFLGIALFTGIFSGGFPAFFLSSFKAATVIKGNYPFFGKGRMRKILVVSQFTLSILFIVGTLGIGKQMKYIRNKDLGYNQDNIVIVPVRGFLRQRLPTIKTQLQKISEVQSVAGSSFDMVLWNSSMDTAWFDQGKMKKCNTGCAWVDEDYIQTLKIELIQGRFFSNEFPSDYNNAYVINEAAVKALGMKNPIGEKIIRGPGAKWADPGIIIGVVKDHHVQSLHQEIRPFILVFSNSAGISHLMIRINSDNIPATIAAVENTIKKVIPNYPVTVSFLDEMLTNTYRYESITGNIINYITALAVFISCLGLLGLASFSVERRTKEIGIRKVMGSSVSGLTKLFLKDFMKWVILANLFAWPLAWYLLNRWMQRFVYRTELSWHIFLLAGTLAFLIALLTVSFHSIRAAQASPIESLRYE